MMDAAEESIPEFLLRRLEDARPSLERNASVRPVYASSPEGPWRLRFREHVGGVKKHRAMPLGNQNIALAVKRLLDSWREEHKEREKAAAQAAANAAKKERRRKRAERQFVRKSVLSLAGGGYLRRRRTAMEFDEAAERGAAGVFAYVMEERWSRPNPKGGRPSKSGLW